MNDEKTQHYDDLEVLQNIPQPIQDALGQKAFKAFAVLGGASQEGAGPVATRFTRIIQAIFTEKGYNQLFKELNDLYNAGKLKEDINTPSSRSFKSFADVLKHIESRDNSDEEILNALQLLFLKISNKETSPQEEIRAFEFMKIIRQLNSSELLTLLANYRCYMENNLPNSDFESWCHIVADEAGHGIKALAEHHGQKLEELKLLGKRTHADQSGISNTHKARLTDLGIELASYITTLEEEK